MECKEMYRKNNLTKLRHCIPSKWCKCFSDSVLQFRNICWQWWRKHNKINL